MIIDETHGKVTIRDGVHIEDTAVIIGPALIGENVYIGHHSVIGGPPQYAGKYPYPIDGERANRGVRIGAGACVREFVQVHQGIIGPTDIGDHSLIMTGCHIAHDVMISDDCVIGSLSAFGGHTYVDRLATLGIGVVTHPWIVIGQAAMVGLNSSVIRNVEPYQKVVGSPAKLIGKNTGAGGQKEKWVRSDLDQNVVKAYDFIVEEQDADRIRMKEENK